MKINNLHILIVLFLTFLTSCSKDEERSSNSAGQNTSTYTGTYKGSVSVYLNNSFFSTQQKTVTISAGSNSGSFFMVNDIFMSNTCLISNNILNIPIDTTATTPAFHVLEYGTGTFNGNSLSIDFHQDQINPTTQAVMNTARWTGTLTLL